MDKAFTIGCGVGIAPIIGNKPHLSQEKFK